MHIMYATSGRIRNIAHTVVLLGAMVGLAAILGWIVAGDTGILWGTVFVFFLLILSPRMNLPMTLRMYGARPLGQDEAPMLHLAAAELARRAQLPAAPRLYYIRSATPNAFTLGSQYDSAIAVSDGLIRLLSGRELVAVLAHETAHIANNDLRLMSIADIFSRITSLFSFLGQLYVLISLPLLLMDQVTISWTLLGVLLLAPSLSGLLQLALSRTRELDADHTGALLCGDPAGLASGLRKLEQLQTSWLQRLFVPNRKNPNPSLLRTHPLTTERMQRLLNQTSSPGMHPPLYPQVAQAAMPYLQRTQPVLRTPRWRMGGFWY